MERGILTLFASLILLSLAGCGEDQAVNPKISPESEQQALLTADKQWAAAAAAGDVDRVLSYWAEDAIGYAPGRPAFIGKEAISEFVRGNRAIPGFSISWEPSAAVLSESGELGYTTGSYQVTVPGGPQGGLITIKGFYVENWRKLDGSWKCVVGIQTPGPTQS